MIRYLKIWKRLATLMIATMFSNRIDSSSYLLGKILRFLFFVAFILALFRENTTFLGYDTNEFLLVFFTFNIVDLLSQILYRGVYFFPDDVRKGIFDFSLVKPVNPLFAAMVRLDILDLFFITPVIGATIYAMAQMEGITALNVLFYVVFLVIGLIIGTAFHVLSAAFTIQSPDNNGFIWFYREVFGISRFPEETFSGLLRGFFTFVIPAFIVATYPVKVLLGELGLSSAILGILYAIIFFGTSLLIWRWSLKKYSSASS